MKVESRAELTATVRLVQAASITSGRFSTVSYQCKVKCPSGRVGKRSELKEKMKLQMIGVKMKQKAPRIYT
jgi:hypothetical protein